MGNGSLTPICSLSKRSLSPSLTVHQFPEAHSFFLSNQANFVSESEKLYDLFDIID